MTRLSTPLLIFSMLAMPVLSLRAAEDDSERNTSVYDKHPECMERSEGGSSNPKCTPQDGPPNRKGIAARNASDPPTVGSPGTAHTPGDKAIPHPSSGAGAESAATGR